MHIFLLMLRIFWQWKSSKCNRSARSCQWVNERERGEWKTDRCMKCLICSRRLPFSFFFSSFFLFSPLHTGNSVVLVSWAVVCMHLQASFVAECVHIENRSLFSVQIKRRFQWEKSTNWNGVPTKPQIPFCGFLSHRCAIDIFILAIFLKFIFRSHRHLIQN